MVYFGSQCLNLLNIVKSIIYLSHTIAAAYLQKTANHGADIEIQTVKTTSYMAYPTA